MDLGEALGRGERWMLGRRGARCVGKGKKGPRVWVGAGWSMESMLGWSGTLSRAPVGLAVPVCMGLDPRHVTVGKGLEIMPLRVR